MKIFKNILGPAAFLMLATIVVNAGNYGLNLLLARWLGPSGFSEANLLATLVMLLSFLAMGLQLTMTKLSAEDRSGLIAQLSVRLNRMAWLLTLAIVLISPVLADFFNFSSFLPIVILAIGIPFYFRLSVVRGIYQGTGNFVELGKTYLMEMLLRLVTTLGLLLMLKKFELSSEAVALGFLASFIFTAIIHRVSIKGERADTPLEQKTLKPIMTFMGIMMVYELSQILINNSDVLLVMHFFDGHTAGLYASLALLGRAVFFATWSVVTVLFPKVIENKKAGRDTAKLFFTALATVAGIGFTMVIGAWLFGSAVMNLAFGETYVEISEYLWLYALITTLFACANVFVYYNMSLERYLPIILSCLAGVLQIVLICIWHDSTLQILLCQLSSISLLFISLLINQFLVSEDEEIALTTASFT